VRPIGGRAISNAQGMALGEVQASAPDQNERQPESGLGALGRVMDVPVGFRDEPAITGGRGHGS
jgi:hypothetical protein